MNKSFVLFFFLSIQLFSQNQFPIGIYINTHGPQDRLSNYPQIDSIGFNYIIEATRGIKDYINNIDFNIIPCNSMDSLDYVHRYTKGILKTWQAEELVDTNKVGFKSPDGIGFVAANHIETPWEEEYIKPKYLLTGPDYFQYSHYGGGFGGGTSINYMIEFRMKIAEEHKINVPICKLEAAYYKDGILTILSDTIVYSNQLSTEYTNIYLEYSYPFATSSAIEKGFQKGTEPEYLYGVKFNVIWLGNEKLYVDYVRLYDSEYGYKLQYMYDSVYNNILQEILDYNYPNINYFYSFDEPHSLDNYEPYKIVSQIISSLYNPKFNILYPNWKK
ncbi:MAG TPA: hypothetical protein VFF33_00080 [Ignavibacteriaceae bacterium]|nr:hypothetical protein [Ignavibacteriaceae bacterium]